MFSALKQILSRASSSPAFPLERMRLGPEGNPDNPLMLQFFTWDCLHEEMSWWKHFETEVPRLAEMGFTQIWLPPPNKAAEPTGRGYDAYDLWDLGEFDQRDSVATRWGTREEFLQACEAAQAHGMDILIDAVLNHKLGADKTERFLAVPVRAENRLKASGPARIIEGWTVFDFPGRNNKYSSMKWTEQHFTGVDCDRMTRARGIYRIAGSGHKGWSRNVDTELGNYDYLLGIDIDHRHPDVQRDLHDWGTWILKTTNASGFRLDAIKHIDRKFVLQFLQTARSNTGNEKMFVVSELWSGNVKSFNPYINAFKGETAFFDVPLHMNFCQAGRQRKKYDLRRVFTNTLMGTRPGYAVTFVDNHDTVSSINLLEMSRCETLQVEGQSLESWVEPNFKIQAYALILLRNTGYPCVFYGDLYPNREGYNENTARYLKRLIEARKLFAYGDLVDYPAQKNCIGFVRKGDTRHPGCAVILSNLEDETSQVIHVIRMYVGLEDAGATYRSFLNQHGELQIGVDGWGDFSCFANHVQIWVKGIAG